jgi:hypothetical protein
MGIGRLGRGERAIHVSTLSSLEETNKNKLSPIISKQHQKYFR